MIDLLEDLPDDLRLNALTHPAYSNTRAGSYERLEFLGDSVLDLVITNLIYRSYPDLDEGSLSKLRAVIVSRDSCEKVAVALGLGDAMITAAARYGAVAIATAKKLSVQRNALAALTESVIGAAFLAHGLEAITPVLEEVFADRIEHALLNRIDAKSELQELASREHAVIRYEEVNAEGPAHDRRFTMAAVVVDMGFSDGDSSSESKSVSELVGLRAEGAGRSKQEAQQVAAAAVLDEIERSQESM